MQKPCEGGTAAARNPPLLLGMVDWPRRPPDWQRRVAGAAECLDGLILRARQEQGPALVAAARQLAEAVRGACPLILGADPGLARELGFAGIHLAESAPPMPGLRQAWPGAWVSRSVHPPLAPSAWQDMDAVVLGNLFPTRSKPGKPGLAGALVREMVGRCPLPVLAIGGITPDNLMALAHLGLAGVVVVDGLWTAPDSRMAACRLRAGLTVANGFAAWPGSLPIGAPAPVPAPPPPSPP